MRHLKSQDQRQIPFDNLEDYNKSPKPKRRSRRQIKNPPANEIGYIDSHSRPAQPRSGQAVGGADIAPQTESAGPA